MKFEKGFDGYVCPGDVITTTVEGFEIAARIEHDFETHIDDDNVHNVDQTVTCCNVEQRKALLAARESWLRGEWQYVGVVLSVARAGVVLDEYAASLWGICCNYPDGDNEYISDVANELLPEAVQAAETTLAKLCKSVKVSRGAP